MYKFLAVVISLLLIASPAAALEGTAVGTIPDITYSITVTEIYPNAENASGTSESGNPQTKPTANEFIEIFNASDSSADLTGFSLTRDGSSTVSFLDGITVGPQEYIAVFPTFAILNTASSIYLNYPLDWGDEPIVIAYEYPSFSVDDQNSWSSVGNDWQKETPTPGEANPEPEVAEELPTEEEIDTNLPDNEEDEVPIDIPKECIASTILINEVVANPAGSDSLGGEFIELYNAGDTSVDLTGCTLSTDKKQDISLDSVEIAAGGYYVHGLSSDLLNNGGTVTLTTTIDESVVEYPTLGDDISWSIIDGVWETTSVMTPGSENEATPIKEVQASESTDTPTPCPEGKFRNPETNRCKNVAETAASLLPCSAGSVRNPETNRCRKVTAIAGTSTLKPCAANQERNPTTNRCRNIAGASNEPKPCEEGYERNPETNRCRKAVGSVAAARTFDDTPAERGLHSGIIISMTVLAFGYAAYEYRLDIANIVHRIKKKELKNWLRQTL